MKSSTFYRVAGAIAVMTVVIPCLASSCPVCYGASDTGATQSVNAAIISLLGVTGGVLGAFGTMFVRMRRRMKAAANAERNA